MSGILDFFGLGGGNQNLGQAAALDTQQSFESAVRNNFLTNPNINTIFGNQRVTFDPTTGQPTIWQNPTEEEANIAYSGQRTRQGIANAIETYGVPAITRALNSSYGIEGAPMQDYAAAYKPPVGQTYGINQKDPMQKHLDFSSAPAMPEANASVRDQVSRSIYDQGAQFLDQQFGGQQKALDTRLSNQGIFPGSEGYTGGQTDLGNQRTQAYGDLINRAIMGGGDAMAQLFGMGLSARQQGVGELQTQGEFTNNAQLQDFNEQMAQAGLTNSAVVNQYNIAGNQAGLYNSGRSNALAEQVYRDTGPLNAFNSLASGAQMTPPPSSQFNPNVMTPASQYSAAVATNANQNANSNRNANMFGQFLNIGSQFIPKGSGSGYTATGDPYGSSYGSYNRS